MNKGVGGLEHEMDRYTPSSFFGSQHTTPIDKINDSEMIAIELI